jgi:hypothetical protein
LNSLQKHPTTLQRFGWEVSLVALISALIVILAAVTRLFGHPRAPDQTMADTSTISKSTSRRFLANSLPADLPRPDPTEALPARTPRTPVRSGRRPSQTSDPHQVIIGPNTISGRFILLANNRRRTGLTTDELTLRLRVVSLAAANLVTPYQSWMLEVRAPGQAPIQPKEPFSHPVPAGDTREDEITFTIPSDLSLDHGTLSINYYNETKTIPLDLPTHTLEHEP